MILGAVIVGTAVGLVAMAAAFVAGAGLLAAFLTYWIVGLLVTTAIVAAKLLLCRTGAGREPASDRSVAGRSLASARHH